MNFIKFKELIDILDNFKIVESSHISAVGTKDNYLIVFFKNNTAYRYPNQSDYFDRLVSAESVGKLFHQEVRHQACEKLMSGDWPD